MFGVAVPAVAELQPNEVAIIAAKGNQKSVALATYYSKARSIPTSNILQLDLPTTVELTRAQWKKQVRPAIRRWLADKKRLRTIRCLVTTWGVPLKIAAEENPKELRRLIAYLKLERRTRVRTINELAQGLEQLAGGQPTRIPLAENAPITEIRTHIDTLVAE